ncbi:hypothetical protein NA56DRAFT_708568 [Hyaloscypha hepaticicola]|uniref:Uncharacterized protein n=1 Tax=Hyaloscypha hepaticicola TaxID=2082293 RepID=A0A2J6PRM1_9HELO|nr:hypothetical protein NA56DRAFT_708568 [Hyaloscypha hepaticicola]
MAFRTYGLPYTWVFAEPASPHVKRLVRYPTVEIRDLRESRAALHPGRASGNPATLLSKTSTNIKASTGPPSQNFCKSKRIPLQYTASPPNNLNSHFTNHLLKESKNLFSRSLSADTKINLILGVFTIVTGVLSTLLAWALWRLTRDRRRQLGYETLFPHSSKLSTATDINLIIGVFTVVTGPTIDADAIELAPAPRPQFGYEVALRFGRNV